MMRRSAGMGGGSVIRAVGRVVGAGVKGAGSSSARPARPARVATVPSPPSPSFATSAPGAGWGSSPCFCEGDEWETVGAAEAAGEEDGIGMSERFIFGPAPSEEEAQEAVSTLQQIFVPVTFSQVIEDGCPSLNKDAVDTIMIAADKTQKGSSFESDWIEPALHVFSSHTAQSHERERVLDAFRLLQINPSIQRMVVSLSSDKAVWDAVMNNEVVQELKKSLYEAKRQSSEECPDIAAGILRWILDKTKAKMVEFFDMVAKLVNEVFHSQEKDKNSDNFDAALRSSFMLSLVVVIIVIVARIQKA